MCLHQNNQPKHSNVLTLVRNSTIHREGDKVVLEEADDESESRVKTEKPEVYRVKMEEPEVYRATTKQTVKTAVILELERGQPIYVPGMFSVELMIGKTTIY